LADFRGLSVVDTSYHWAYSIPGYENFSIETHGTPVIPHLHGAHADAPFDGNPEYFFTPEWKVKGPHWMAEEFVYPNVQPAAMLWYHDHAIGITRLNVHAGLANFTSCETTRIRSSLAMSIIYPIVLTKFPS